jgi:hypothetical protein
MYETVNKSAYTHAIHFLFLYSVIKTPYLPIDLCSTEFYIAGRLYIILRYAGGYGRGIFHGHYPYIRNS